MTKSNHEEKNSTYRSQKGVFVHSHQESLENAWPQHYFQKVVGHKHSPHKYLSMLKKRYLTLSSHLSPQSSHESQGDISQSFIVHAKIPSRAMSFFSWKTKRPNEYKSFWSDWRNRTLDRKSGSEILKKVLCFQTEWDRQRKSACISLCWWMCTKFLIEDTVNILDCIHVSLCTDDLTGFNSSLSVNPVLPCIGLCCVCVRTCMSVCEGEKFAPQQKQPRLH